MCVGLYLVDEGQSLSSLPACVVTTSRQTESGFACVKLCTKLELNLEEQILSLHSKLSLHLLYFGI